MTDPSDDAIDALLRDEFSGPVPAGDFCGRVMQRLPRQRRRALPLFAGIAAGVAACWLCLEYSPLVHIGFVDWLRGEPSSAALVLAATIVGLALLSLGWTAVEADDR